MPPAAPPYVYWAAPGTKLPLPRNGLVVVCPPNLSLMVSGAALPDIFPPFSESFMVIADN